MKKSASGQNIIAETRSRGMYGSMHSRIFGGLRLPGFHKEAEPVPEAGSVSAVRGAAAGTKNAAMGRGRRTAGAYMGSYASAGVVKTAAVPVGAVGAGRTGGRAKYRYTAANEIVKGYRITDAEPILTLPSLGRLRSLITLRGIIVAFVAAITMAAAVILMTFNFEKAVIYGNTKYSQKQIESFITRGRLGENTFVMALKFHHRTVTDIPFVDQIDIDIISPSTVRVNIKEKSLDACVIREDDKVYFSKEGVVQTISGRSVENTTVVNGLDLKAPVTGSAVEADNQTGKALVLDLLRAMDRYGIHADSIDVDKRNNLTASFGQVLVKLGKTGYDGKMYKIHQMATGLKDRSGVISMTGFDYDGENIVLSPPGGIKRNLKKKTEEKASAKETSAEKTSKEKTSKEKASEQKASKEKSGTEKTTAEKKADVKTEAAADKKAAAKKTEAAAEKKETAKKTEAAAEKKAAAKKTEAAAEKKETAEKDKTADTKKETSGKENAAEQKKETAQKEKAAEQKKETAQKDKAADQKKETAAKDNKAADRKAAAEKAQSDSKKKAQ